MQNKKEVVQKYLEETKEKFDWFFGECAKIVDNKTKMHMIIRTKHGFKIPSRENVENIYYFLRDIFDKSDNIFININHDRLLEYWFVFENLSE